MTHLSTPEWQDAYGRGGKLAEAILPDIEKVIEEAIEGWFTEHTSMNRDEPRTQEFLETIRLGCRRSLARGLDR